MALDASESLFEAISKEVQTYAAGSPLELLTRAFQFARKAHQEQLRAGGDPYIVHPLHVARILTEFRLDVPTLAAGLLHDVLEDTTVTRETLKQEFSEEVAHIVEGVTKIDTLEQHAMEESDPGSKEWAKQAENWRKMLVATAQDIRVILVKLADRKHNMETLEHLPEERRKRIAEETLNLYAPLAQRLGIYQLKSDLEDLSFKHLRPEIYQELKAKIAAGETRRSELLRRAREKVEALLKEQFFPCRISARPKNLYSVFRKMERQNKPFEEIQDLAGIRVITDTIEHCYAILGLVHTRFAPLAGSFTDYIAVPKKNLYQSLHTTVELFKDVIVEIQIRSEEMHRIAEYGVAAHWRYKLESTAGPGPARNARDTFEEKLDWLKQVLEWQQETKNPREFLEELKVELEFDQIFVFTPKGAVIKLPLGSTPVDFAYAVHTELGNSCVGARVDGKMSRLDQPLKSGEVCEVQTRKGQHPHKDWLDFVKTPRARSKIRKFIRESEGKGA